jgi:hypothetical protein
LQQIQTAQKTAQDKLAQLAADQAQLKTEIASLDQQIADNVKAQQQMAGTYIVDPSTGRMIPEGYPAEYYQIDRENSDLKSRHQAAAAKLIQLADETRATQAQLPIPPYTGVQQIIGEEGTPIALPPTTLPATQATTSP